MWLTIPMSNKALLWALGAAAVLVIILDAALQVSPWPSALFFRQVMNYGGAKTARALGKHVPAGVVERLNEHYDPNDRDAFLDAFYPSGAGQALPTIVWVHGGGFISGGKAQIANYLKILAARGFTAVGVDYALAPGKTYPTPIRQVNTALTYLETNAARLHIDPSRFFLAGDSAGAQIAAQLAIVISAPPYAHEMGIAASIKRPQLRGVILYCGVYDAAKLHSTGFFGRLLRTVTWSYFGSKDFMNDRRADQFSVVRHVTAEFPPMFISVGNGDPLAAHSKLLAETAAGVGVAVETLFFPDNYAPPVRHEYQFNLDTAAGRTALERSVKFMAGKSL